MPDLIADLQHLRYGQGELSLADLQQQLAVHNSVPPFVISRETDVLMGLDGIVQQRYRFTHRGLSMLCSRLATGLAPLVTDIAGLKVGEASATTDTALAVRIVNGIIRSRFRDKLEGCRMILDPERNAIEGVVSSRYEHLSNHDWLESCQSFMTRLAGDYAQFLSATLLGRRLLVHFVDNRDWITVQAEGTRDQYRRGWSFTNSETGECSVRVGLLIVDAADNAAFKHVARRTHAKSLRETKGAELLAKLRLDYERLNDDLLRRNILRLRRQALPRAENDNDLASLADNLASQLGRRLPRSTARAVASLALSAAGFRTLQGTGGLVSPQVALLSANYTYYHLYNALTAHARDCLPREQENAEALAYDLLRDRFRIAD